MEKNIFSQISWRSLLLSIRSSVHVEGNSKILRIFYLKASERKCCFVAWNETFPGTISSWHTKCTCYSPVEKFRQRSKFFVFLSTKHIIYLFPEKEKFFLNCSSGHWERCFDNLIKVPLPWFAIIFRSTSEENFINSVFQKKTLMFYPSKFFPPSSEMLSLFVEK